MNQRILCITDWHLKDKDPRLISGYVNNSFRQFDEIAFLIEKFDIDSIIFLGDVFDGAINSTAMIYSYTNAFKKLASKATLYLLVGNHFFNYMNSNPEVYLAQPNPLGGEYEPSRFHIPADEPIFHVVKELKINKTQIVFHHFHPKNKEYFTTPDPNCNYVVGLYHDECVLPNSILSKTGYTIQSDDLYLNRVYFGVNLALCGHIHIPMTPTTYGKTALMVPGSISVTENSIRDRHTQVLLPLLDISEETCKLQIVPFNTGAGQMSFAATEAKQVLKEPIKTRREALEKLGSVRYYSIGQYIEDHHYPTEFKQLIQLGASGQLNYSTVSSCIKTLTGKEEFLNGVTGSGDEGIRDAVFAG